MKLLEIYNTFLRRGMPEMEGIIYYVAADDPDLDDIDKEYASSDCDGWKVDDWDGDLGQQHYGPLWDHHVHDLLMMHALRWLKRDKITSFAKLLKETKHLEPSGKN